MVTSTWCSSLDHYLTETTQMLYFQNFLLRKVESRLLHSLTAEFLKASISIRFSDGRLANLRPQVSKIEEFPNYCRFSIQLHAHKRVGWIEWHTQANKHFNTKGRQITFVVFLPLLLCLQTCGEAWLSGPPGILGRVSEAKGLILELPCVGEFHFQEYIWEEGEKKRKHG